MTQLMDTPDEGDQKKTAGALLLSVLIHLIIILLVTVVLVTHPSPVLVEPPKPVELTIMPAPPVEAPPPADAYITTTESQRSETPPEEMTFESDKDTRAASEKPAENSLPIPSQEGLDEKNPQFEDMQFALGPKPREQAPTPPTQTARPIPETKVEPKPVEAKTEEAKPVATPNADDLALLTPQPKKTEPEKTEQAQPASQPAPPPQPQAYRPQTRTTRIQGGISTRGRSAANALATPMGRYKKMLSDAIGSRWYYYVQNDMGLLNIGTVVIRFVVRPNGKVEGVQVLSNSSNETFATTSIRSIIEAEIPPIPPEVASVIDGGKLEVDYTFTIMNR